MFQPKKLDYGKKTSSSDNSNIYVPYQLGSFHDENINGECYVLYEIGY